MSFILFNIFQIYDKIQPAKKDILLKNRESIKPYKLDEEDILLQKTIKDLSKLFYPYVSLQIEPRKRISKTTVADTKSKYGSYLRYKRVSKFDNAAKIELFLFKLLVIN